MIPRVSHHVLRSASALAGLSVVAACYSGGPLTNADGTDNGTTTSSLCAKTVPGPAPLRRLTQLQYDNTVRDLLGDNTHPSQSFPPDQKQGDFTNTAVALTVSPLLAQGYESAAEVIAARAIAKGATFFGCDPVKGEDACAKTFVAAFGKRAYRRPLTTEETQTLFDKLYTPNRMDADFNNGIQAVVEAMLQSASFLYLPEIGAVDRKKDDAVPLTSYEMASRLSYLLWSSMPDDALFAAADADALRTPEQIAAQARRMLGDPKAKSAVEDFFAQWLHVRDLGSVAKDPGVYPDFDNTMRAAMQAETLAFVDWVMWQSDARVETLLTAPVSFINASTAKVYGITGVTSATPVKTDLDPKQRAGIITQPAILTALSKPDRSSPVVRGKFIRERFLCQTISPPPTDVIITPPKITPGVSTRDAFSQHSIDPKCSGCHKLMDPIGFGFESFDGIGRFRTVDQGKPVDASGSLIGSDVDGTFIGAPELAKKLAQSQQVRDCVAVEWFRYGHGRGETPDDACSLDTLKKAFSAANYDVRELIVALTQTDAFRYRPQVKP